MADFESTVKRNPSKVHEAEVDWMLKRASEAGVDFDNLDRDELVKFQQIQHAKYNDWQKSPEKEAVKQQVDQDRAEEAERKKADKARKAEEDKAKKAADKAAEQEASGDEDDEEEDEAPKAKKSKASAGAEAPF